MPFCTVKWCGKNSATSSYAKDGITFHRYPSNPDKKKMWIDATQRENFFPTSNSVICSRHFTPDCFESLKNNRRRIINTAIPTQYLPLLTSPKNTTEQIPIPCLIITTSNVPEQPSQNSMPNDMANYTQYSMMGTVSRLRMKPGCIPTKFKCQENREKITPTSIERPYKKRKTIVECENDLEESVENSSMALKVLPPKKVYQKRPLDTVKGQKVGCSSSHNSPQLKPQFNSPSKKQQKLGKKFVQETIEKKTACKPDLDYLLNKHKFLSKNSKILTCMQLRGNTRKWKEEEKRFSISLYRFIPDSYRLLIDMGIVLPPEATVKRWLFEIPVVNSSPGLAKEECVASVSVKVEPAEECGASIEEQYEEISGASVKEEPEDYGANVKQEDCGSAASACEEHELTLELGPEQLQPQDIAFTPK